MAAGGVRCERLLLCRVPRRRKAGVGGNAGGGGGGSAAGEPLLRRGAKCGVALSVVIAARAIATAREFALDSGVGPAGVVASWQEARQGRCSAAALVRTHRASPR